MYSHSVFSNWTNNITVITRPEAEVISEFLRIISYFGYIMEKQFFIYLMTNPTNSVIYAGVTNNLARRVWEHKNKVGSKFTTRYNVIKLVYYEIFNSPNIAIQREKQIKSGSRKKKIELIKSINPEWKDLSEKFQFYDLRSDTTL